MRQRIDSRLAQHCCGRGHGVLGWTLAMGSDERAAALLLDET